MWKEIKVKCVDQRVIEETAEENTLSDRALFSVLTDCNRQANMMCREHRKANAIRETTENVRGEETSKGTEPLSRSRGVGLACDIDYF